MLLASGVPIEFVVQENSKDYLDMLNSFLDLTAKIILPNGESILLSTEVAPVNYYLNRLILHVDVLLNDTLITASKDMQKYKAYMETY